jgi:hypothetical protein
MVIENVRVGGQNDGVEKQERQLLHRSAAEVRQKIRQPIHRPAATARTPVLDAHQQKERRHRECNVIRRHLG